MGKGIIAGFVATVVLSLLMLMKSMMGLMPELNVIQMLTEMANARMGTPPEPMVGWVLHFIIGTFVYGILYHLLRGALPGGAVVSGIIVGLIGWLVMMIVIMPMAGAGLFGLNLGIMAPIMTMMLHVIFGAVLGFTYRKLA